MPKFCSAIWVFAALFFYCLTACAQSKPRARDLGVPFDGRTGPLNAISDVKGVEVGETTLISGQGPLKVGIGPVRTGVTAILPRGKNSRDAVFAGYFSLNGNGEMTGTHWVDDSGFLDGPILITNTHSVGVVRDGVIYTPSRASILEGITRDSLITIAQDQGYTVIEEPISRDQLYIADEVFVCGTAAEVIGLREIDYLEIGNGKTGAVARALQKAFDELTSGRHPRSAKWLAPVPALVKA